MLANASGKHPALKEAMRDIGFLNAVDSAQTGEFFQLPDTTFMHGGGAPGFDNAADALDAITHVIKNLLAEEVASVRDENDPPRVLVAQVVEAKWSGLDVLQTDSKLTGSGADDSRLDRLLTSNSGNAQ